MSQNFLENFIFFPKRKKKRFQEEEKIGKKSFIQENLKNFMHHYQEVPKISTTFWLENL